MRTRSPRCSVDALISGAFVKALPTYSIRRRCEHPKKSHLVGKVLGHLWTQFLKSDLSFRPEARATPVELFIVSCKRRSSTGDWRRVRDCLRPGSRRFTSVYLETRW